MITFPSIIFAVSILTTTTEIRQGVQNSAWQAAFDITATVALSYRQSVSGTFVIKDTMGETRLLINQDDLEKPPPLPGDIVRATGLIQPTGFKNTPTAYCTNLTIITHGEAPLPTTAAPKRLLNGDYDGHFISVEGIVLDAFQDEIDLRSFFLVLNCDGWTIYATVPNRHDILEQLRGFIGSKVKVSGCSSRSTSHRSMIGQTLSVTCVDDIKVLHAAQDTFDAPAITTQQETADPSTVSWLGRRKVFGRVIAKRHGGEAIIIRTQSNNLATIELAAPTDVPEVGECIEVVGFTETDLYTIHFVRAVWRHHDGIAPSLTISPKTTTANALLTNGKGGFRINPQFHGRAVRLSGTVRDIHRINERRQSIDLHGDGFTIPIDVSAAPEALHDITVGCIISVTGVCLLDTEKWSPHALFPHATGMTITVNSPTDIMLISRPPWWTAGRVAAIAGILFILLVLFLIWNMALKRIVEHRSRQLMREEIVRMHSELKLEERTRLAIELHDTFSQHLAGVSLQIDAAQMAASENLPSALQYLEIARQKMKSCRNNLRNCLWDLRNRIFDEKRLDDAILKALIPHIEPSKLKIDCDIACSTFSENSLHDTLSIVRELAINAERHGHASLITIIGKNESDRLNICVSDNGIGFNMATRPGVREGHFGLQGISERVARLGGILKIDSAPDAGCTITVARIDMNG